MKASDILAAGTRSTSVPGPWKLLVVDDAEEMRAVTRLALDGFTYRGRGLEILEAGSAEEAQRVLTVHPDVAAAIVDVVMETSHAGLDLVRWIRNVQKNRLIRLVVRTGQAGLYPPSSVLTEYQINDYWEKTELTSSRLHMSLTTSLRSYEDLLLLDVRTEQLRRWVDRFPELLGAKDWNSLLRLVMVGLREQFPTTELSAFLCRNDGRRWPLIAGTGDYPSGGGDVLGHINEAGAALLLEAWGNQGLAETPQAMALYFTGAQGNGHLFYLDVPDHWDPYERNVARLVLQNFRAALENRILIADLQRHQKDAETRAHGQTHRAGVHGRMGASLEVVLSFIDIETHDRTGVSGRSVLDGATRRLQVLALLHNLVRGPSQPSVDFQAFLQALVAHDRGLCRPSEPSVEYWGVPLELGLELASPVALAAVEMVDLIRSPRFRGTGPAPVQVILSDSPRQLAVGRPGAEFINPVGPAPLEWSLLATLAAQASGDVVVDGEFLRLSF